MLFLPSGQETETNKTCLSQSNNSRLFSTNDVYLWFLKPGMQPKGIKYNSQANFAPPFFPSGNMGTNAFLSFPLSLSSLSHKHSQVQDSGEGCECIKMEGALQVLKPSTAWETPFLQPGLGRRRRPERVNGGVLSTVRIKDTQELKMGSLSKLVSMESHWHIIISGVLERPAITFLFLSRP